jgi:hypothetical protein
MDETMQFKGTGWDLRDLSDEIVQDLMKQGYDVQSNTSKDGVIIQAKKAGILRDIITANRAFTIAITGDPDDFSVKVGIGKLIQNLGVAAAEAILLSELFLVVDVPEMLWTQYVHNSIVKNIEDTVGQKPDKRTLDKGRAVARDLGVAGRKGKRIAVKAGRNMVRVAKKGGRKAKKTIEAMTA